AGKRPCVGCAVTRPSSPRCATLERRPRHGCRLWKRAAEGRIGMRRRGAVIALVALLLLPAAPPVAADGPVPSLLGGWHWPNGSRPTYKFASSMPLQWMRNEAVAG